MLGVIAGAIVALGAAACMLLCDVIDNLKRIAKALEAHAPRSEDGKRDE